MHRITALLLALVCGGMLAACAPSDVADSEESAGGSESPATRDPSESTGSGVAEGPRGAQDPPPEPIGVASGPDPETALLAGIMVELLELQGLAAETVPFSDARDARRALELGEVDVRPGYTGEAWLDTLGRPDPPSDPGQSYVAVRDHDASQGIVWLRPRLGEGVDEPPANATFAFVVRGPPSVDADIRTMSQLASRLSEQPDAVVCVDQEFGNRPDGLPAVLSAYSVRSDRPFLAADPDEAVLGVAAGDCLAGLTTATDGLAWRAGLQPVVDDLQVFPAFVPLPQLRLDAVTQQPLIRVALGPMSAEMSTEALGRWNARIVAGESIEAVAADAALELYERAGRQPPSDAEA